MTSRLFALAIEANDPTTAARFWAGMLGWESVAAEDGTVLLTPTDDTTFRFRFRPTDRAKVEQNRMHFHLTSTSLEDQQRVVERALELGGRHLDIGQRPEEPHVVLADPEGDELCVIEPGNSFLADCGFFAELSCEGTQELGYFWSAALGMPLVWDRDLETAIRDESGGPKISWGGTRPRPRNGRLRMRFELVPEVGDDPAVEAERLVSLGATRVSESPDGSLELADPDGYEFTLLTSG